MLGTLPTSNPISRPSSPRFLLSISNKVLKPQAYISFLSIKKILLYNSSYCDSFDFKNKNAFQVGCVPPANWPWGVYLPRGVYLPGGVPAQVLPSCEQNYWHTLLKILPCPNFVAGGKNKYGQPAPIKFTTRTKRTTWRDTRGSTSHKTRHVVRSRWRIYIYTVVDLQHVYGGGSTSRTRSLQLSNRRLC